MGSDINTEEKQLNAVITFDAGSDVGNGIVEDVMIDAKLERKIMLKRDFILLPTIGLLYMIVGVAWYRSKLRRLIGVFRCSWIVPT